MPPICEDFLDRIDQELKGRQTLLAVDDDSPLGSAGGKRGWLKHHGTQEVRLGSVLHQ